MNKEKSVKVKTIEVFTARTGHICPNNPIMTLEKAAKKLESITKHRPKLERKKSPKKLEPKNKNVILMKESNSPRPRKKSPKASSPHLKYGVFRKPPRMRGQTFVQMEKRRHRIGVLPSSADSPVMMYRASPLPRLAVSDIVHLDIKPRQVFLKYFMITNLWFFFKDGSCGQPTADSEYPSPHRGQGAAFSWRGVTKAS